MVADVESKERKRRPSPPFTTSTLQQEAARKLGFTTSRTMKIAQGLYEGVALGDEGMVGLITYMRTDSVIAVGRTRSHDLREVIATRLRRASAARTAALLSQTSPRTRRKPTRRSARPPRSIAPKDVAAYLNDEQRKLYELIWKRTLASQMQHATLNTVSVDLDRRA